MTAAAQPLQAAILPSGFVEDIVVRGLNFPTSFSMLPDGRILIGEKSGFVRIFKDGALLPTPFIDIRAQ
ncbi:MAG: hypothetical protein H0V47_07270 [Chloroflexia bacterium]|nr:hypothetical protein [Chloroflexia bacterium]